MKKRVNFVSLLVGLVVFFNASLALSQEGHPLDGTWRGTLESGSDTQAVLLIIDYDGDNIQGMINPGRSSFPFSSAQLDAPTWTLTVQAENRDGDQISFEAVLKEVGARNRYLEGSWTQAETLYQFRVSRE